MLNPNQFTETLWGGSSWCVTTLASNSWGNDIPEPRNLLGSVHQYRQSHQARAMIFLIWASWNKKQNKLTWSSMKRFESKGLAHIYKNTRGVPGCSELHSLQVTHQVTHHRYRKRLYFPFLVGKALRYAAMRQLKESSSRLGDSMNQSKRMWNILFFTPTSIPFSATLF